MSHNPPPTGQGMVCEIAGRAGDLTGWRHHLHAHPELAFQEHRTSAFVAEKLRSFGIETFTGIAGTGVVGVLRNGAGQASIGLRADLDALSIHEAADRPHRSTVDGTMHACGHDGHSVMLLEAARYLARSRSFDGTVNFIFQPAEENEGGAKAMVEAGLFELFPCDGIYALHNAPGVPFGAFASRSGAFLASMDRFTLTVLGQGGHAATPHLCRDSLMAAVQVATTWQSIIGRRVAADQSAVISLTQFDAGETWNALPMKAVLRGTVRTHNPVVQDVIEAEMRASAEHVCAAYGVKAEWSYERKYPPLINTPAELQRSLEVAARVSPTSQVYAEAPPVMGSDDFAEMLRERPGSYLWLGSGDQGDVKMLHDPHYDFNDDLLPIGASFWVRLVESALPRAT